MSIYKNGVWTSTNNYESRDVYNHKYSNGDMPTYSTGAGGWTKTIKNGYTNFRYDHDKPTGDSWPNMDCPVFNFIIGDKYLWRCWIKCNTCTTGTSVDMRASRVKNDWVTNMKTICSPTLADGEWHEYYVMQTIPETFVRSGTTMTSAPVFEFYTSNLKNAGTDTIVIDFDVKNIEVLHAEEYVSQGAFFEDGDKTKIYKDQIRGHEFIEI